MADFSPNIPNITYTENHLHIDVVPSKVPNFDFSVFHVSFDFEVPEQVVICQIDKIICIDYVLSGTLSDGNNPNNDVSSLIIQTNIQSSSELVKLLALSEESDEWGDLDSTIRAEVLSKSINSCLKGSYTFVSEPDTKLKGLVYFN